MFHIIHVVGARPNFIKVAPVIAALARLSPNVRQTLVHTGQHYDANMSEVFFRQLEIPRPGINLEVGAGTHSNQTAQIIMGIERVILEQTPDQVLVYGDVNSTVAAALVCAQMHVPVAHVEAGLRSHDRRMPEELNRLVTDHLSDLLFTPSVDGDENLLREGISADKIVRVGNVIIDTLVRLDPLADALWASRSGVLARIPERYALLTLHRPSNVDDPDVLLKLVGTLEAISDRLPVVFPIHPRTRQRLRDLHRPITAPDMRVLDPVGYVEFLALQKHASVVITDSGGVQEETTYLGVPCLTVRENTERPITIEIGTNILIGLDMDRLTSEVDRILVGKAKQGAIPPFWDGMASERIADRLLRRYA